MRATPLIRAYRQWCKDMDPNYRTGDYPLRGRLFEAWCAAWDAANAQTNQGETQMKDNDYYLHCAYEMEAMGGSFASLIARAYYAADKDNKQRLITAFGHLFDRYAPTQGETA